MDTQCDKTFNNISIWNVFVSFRPSIRENIKKGGEPRQLNAFYKLLIFGETWVEDERTKTFSGMTILEFGAIIKSFVQLSHLHIELSNKI